MDDNYEIGIKTTLVTTSIVGAETVVKGKFPNNCVIAGNPAKIVKKDVTWDRSDIHSDIDRCDEENIRHTEEI